jgi:type I restriction enzyme, S subunit
MELRAGYKQTEVGIIPEEWEFLDASELDPFITSGSRGWAKYYSDRGALFIRITNLDRQCLFPDLASPQFVQLPESDTEGLRTTLRNGDILISITADIGIIGYVNDAIPKPAYINQHIACLRIDRAKADSLFQSYYLASLGSQKRFAELTDIGAKSGINLATIGKLKLLLPPLPEQSAIAAALSDADALIASLAALIAKKQNLRQAAMQELLTGKTRLPGFCDPWAVSTVGSEFEIKLGKMLDAQKNSGTPKPFIGNKAVQWNRIDIDDLPTVPMSRADIEKYRLRKGDLLVCEGGEVGRAAIWDAQIDECYYQKALHRLRPLRDFNPIFMATLLQLWSNSGMFSNYVTQTSIAHLPREKFLEMPLPVPSISEQTAIVELLTDMDAEVTALENRRDKALVS